MLFALKLIVFFSIHSTENVHEVIFAHAHQGGIQIGNADIFLLSNALVSLPQYKARLHIYEDTTWQHR